MILVYNYQLINNHIVFESNGAHFLLDTGSPVSMGDHPIYIRGHLYDLDATHWGLVKDDVRHNVDENIDGILGSDLLQNTTLFFWLHKYEFFIWNESPDSMGTVTPITFTMGTPTMRITVNGHETQAFVDTGAAHSYISSDLLPTSETADTFDDFYPGMGTFTANQYNTSITINDQDFELPVGTLPAMLEQQLLSLGPKAILGLDAIYQINGPAFAVNYAQQKAVLTS